MVDKLADDEKAVGFNVTESYCVLLPDGRIETITYNIKDENGYISDIKYEFEF